MSRCIRTCLGENIRRLRRDRGHTQRDLAKIASVSISFLQNIECGKRWISPDKIALLALALGVSESELFRDCETDTPLDRGAALAMICQSFGISLTAEQLKQFRHESR